jgi:hypothetical protein
MVKILTMVKDEVDIVEDWIIYHGSMFGFENLYIIDNYSVDGTYEKIMNLKLNTPINVYREWDYTLKGKYMTELIRRHCMNDRFSFPIDIDEFIVLYEKNKNTISIDKDKIINYFTNLPVYKVYKTNYIISKITNDHGYKRATVDAEVGYYADLGCVAKSFFTSRLLNDEIDHGNHYNCSNYYITDLCLVHYHYRNLEQIKQKTNNNINGLGYRNDLNSLKTLLSINEKCSGNHHVKNQILLFEDKYVIPSGKIEENDIFLNPLSERITNGFF